MTDAVQSGPQSAPQASSSYDGYEMQHAKMLAIQKLIWLITAIAGAISLIVVLSVVVLAIAQIVIGKTTPDRLVMPEVLVNWGGIILGFYFGQFVTLLKDFIGLTAEPRTKGTVARP